MKFLKLFKMASQFIRALLSVGGQKGVKPRVLVIRLDAIGDFFLWLPFANEIRKKYPANKYHLTLIANKLWIPLAKKLLDYDEYLEFAKGKANESVYVELKKAKYEIVLHPTYSREWEADLLVLASQSKNKLGYTGNTSNMSFLIKLLTDGFYSQLVTNNDAYGMEVEKNIHFMKSGLNINCEYIGRVSSKKKGVFILFPGASWDGKCWPLERFAEIGTRIHKETGWKGIICGGPGEESLGESLASLLSFPYENLCGKTSLEKALDIISSASLLVSNDTSAVHMAQYVGTKTVCILGGGHFGRFLPYTESLKQFVQVVYKEKDCYHCNWLCPIRESDKHPVPCIDEVLIEDVWSAIEKQI